MDLTKPKGKVCVSLGCGLGRFLRAYVERDSKSVIGVDLNLENLFKCKQTGASLVRCDIEQLPLRTNSVGAMECVGTVEHLPSPRRLIEEISRVSAKDSVSFVTWVAFDWSKALTDKRVCFRLLYKFRDKIFDLLPTYVGEKMGYGRLRVPFLGDYGIFHNSGFDFSEVSRIYSSASMHISWSKRMSDQNLIAVAALPAH